MFIRVYRWLVFFVLSVPGVFRNVWAQKKGSRLIRGATPVREEHYGIAHHHLVRGGLKRSPMVHKNLLAAAIRGRLQEPARQTPLISEKPGRIGSPVPPKFIFFTPSVGR